MSGLTDLDEDFTNTEGEGNAKLFWVKGRAGRPKHVNYEAKTRRAIWLRMYEDGRHCDDIAAEFGKHPKYVEKAIRKACREARKPTPGERRQEQRDARPRCPACGQPVKP